MAAKNILLSAVVIARNEEKMIEGCLKTLGFADEIVVVDDVSDDQTKKLALRYTPMVFTTGAKFDYARLRNFGLSRARGTWVLYVDADERVPKSLAREIRALVVKFPPKGRFTLAELSAQNFFLSYKVPRRNYYLGHEFRYGGAWPDYQHRLFYRPNLKKWHGVLQEGPELEVEKVGRLREPIWHFSHRSIKTMMEKTNAWSDIEASLFMRDYKNHPRMTGPRFVAMIFRKSWEMFVNKKIWKEGTVGWVEGIFQVFSVFITYAKLWEKQENLSLKTYSKLEKGLKI